MKATTCADSASQLSEKFMTELQLSGVPANNLAACNKLPVAVDQSVNAMQLPPDFFYLQNEEGDTQLHLAILFDKVDIASILIRIAPNPSYLDICNDECLTALHYAVLSDYSAIVRQLVLAGANTQARTSQGDTALHLAVQQGHADCIKALIQPLSFAEMEALTKADASRPLPQLPVYLDARNYDGVYPIHLAANKNDVQLVHQLLLAGANVNAQEGLGGKTALHMAIENDHAAMVHYLAQIPTTLNATTYGGEAAYQVAVDCAPHYVEALLRYGAAPVVHTHDDDSMSDDSSSDGDYDVPSYMEYTDSSYSNVCQTATLVSV